MVGKEKNIFKLVLKGWVMEALINGGDLSGENVNFQTTGRKDENGPNHK